ALKAGHSTLFPAQARAPRGVEVIRNTGADHLHTANQVVLDPKGLSDVNARNAARETTRVGDLTIGQLDLRDSAVHIKHAVAPDDAAFFVDQREAPMVDVIDDTQIAAFKLLLATRAHVVEVRRGRPRTRGVCRVGAVLDAVTVLCERIETFAVILLDP